MSCQMSRKEEMPEWLAHALRNPAEETEEVSFPNEHIEGPKE